MTKIVPPFKTRNSSFREASFIKAAYKRTIPFSICFMLLHIAGFLYISFDKGVGQAICYTILPTIAGVAASVIFKKLDFQKHLCESSNKVKAINLASFTLLAVIFSLMKNPDGFAPSLLILYIPVVYSLYVSVIPHKNKGIAKPIICGLFCAGALLLSVLRPTGYAVGGLFAILMSLLAVTLIAIKSDRFDHMSKKSSFAITVVVFGILFAFLLFSASHFAAAVSPADITPTGPAEVMQNIGLVPMLLICALHLAAIVFSFILAAGKSYLFKHITVGVTTVFSVAFLLSILTSVECLFTNFGVLFLECTELSSTFIVIFTLIILDTNKDDLSVHSFADSFLYHSLYTGIFRDESYSKGRLLIVQGPSGYSKTQYLSEITDNEPDPILVFTMEAIYARLIQTLRDHGVPISNSPELVFPEIIEDSVSLILIEDVDMILSGKTAIQAEFAQLLNTLMIDRGISIVIAGIDLRQRVPALWDGLTNPNNERFCGSVSYMDL